MACAREVGAGCQLCLHALSCYRPRGSTAAERPRNGCGQCQRAGALLCAEAATARATPSPAREPLDESDKKGPHRVVDLHEAPRHPSVDPSRRGSLLRHRIFPCGQHRVPDHLRERLPSLAGTNHRLRARGCLPVPPASASARVDQRWHPRSERPKLKNKSWRGGGVSSGRRHPRLVFISKRTASLLS